MEVLHDGRWHKGWITAQRRDSDGWRAYVRYVVAVGMQHWQWKHETELRRWSGG